MLNIIHYQGKLDENLSLAMHAKSGNNGSLSQEQKAVTPNGLNWLFYCPKCANPLAIPPYNHFATTGNLPLMVWLILQNKPFGEYAKRLLFVPRVRPRHPIIGFLLKNQKGAFPC